jgi:hypothetical protein
MAKCPDYGGSKLVTVLVSVPSPDPQAGLAAACAPCPRCSGTGAVPDPMAGASVSQDPREATPKRSWWGRLFG